MFQQVITTLGQLDGQYQMKTKVLAEVRQVKDVEFSQKSGKPKQSIYLTDESGEDSWVTIIGKFDALDDTSLGKTYEFLVWPFKAEQSPKTTLYCWINRQVPQNNPQNPHQASQAPPQATNIGAGIDIQAQFIALAERFIQAIEYVVHGNIEPPKRASGTNPDYVGDDPPPPEDEDIPF